MIVSKNRKKEEKKREAKQSNQMGGDDDEETCSRKERMKLLSCWVSRVAPGIFFLLCRDKIEERAATVSQKPSKAPLSSLLSLSGF